MIVSLTRVLNEDDVIEAFIRHNARFVDHMLLLDNGSIDGTLDILRSLKAEGLPLTVLQTESVHFMERALNTVLYHAAMGAFAAKWLLFLDADEFIDERGPALRPTLGVVPSDLAGASLLLRNYTAPADAPPDLLVPRRQTLRDIVQPVVIKCFVRGGLPSGMAVEPGNHGVTLDGARLPTAALDGVFLAHYPVRDVLGSLVKAVIGRAKVLAAGQVEIAANSSEHYTGQLATMRDDPGRLLRNADLMAGVRDTRTLLHDPLDYQGGPLRYTAAGDVEMKAVRRLADAAEKLAASHGRLLDGWPEGRAAMERANMQSRLLF